MNNKCLRPLCELVYELVAIVESGDGVSARPPTILFDVVEANSDGAKERELEHEPEDAPMAKFPLCSRLEV